MPDLRERARAVYHDWRERCLADPQRAHYSISSIDLMEDAITAALEAVAREASEIAAEYRLHAIGCCDDAGEIEAKIRARFNLTGGTDAR